LIPAHSHRRPLSRADLDPRSDDRRGAVLADRCTGHQSPADRRLWIRTEVVACATLCLPAKLVRTFSELHGLHWPMVGCPLQSYEWSNPLWTSKCKKRISKRHRTVGQTQGWQGRSMQKITVIIPHCGHNSEPNAVLEIAQTRTRQM
jgi:hypothetical protein